MSTATEILIMMSKVQPKIDAMMRRQEVVLRDLVIYGTSIALGREVCAKRARKLRRRGEDVRFSGLSKTGKPRFCWMRRVDPLSIYLESP